MKIKEIAGLLLLALILTCVGCENDPFQDLVSSSPSPKDQTPDPGPKDTLQTDQDTFPADSQTILFATVVLPMHDEATDIAYELVNGNVVIEGDIILGDAFDLVGPPPPDHPFSSGSYSPRPGVNVSSLVVRDNEKYYWLNGVVPYEIKEEDFDAAYILTIEAAIEEMNTRTNVTFQPRDGENDYVRFVRTDEDGVGGRSKVGRKGGRQDIQLNPGGCGLGCKLHEMMHAIGIWHEQSRGDRDLYVEILWDNIEEKRKPNFNKHLTDGLIIGDYDFTSLMHYSATAFGKKDVAGNVLPTIVDPVTQLPIQGVQRSNFSALDIEGINTLYSINASYCGGNDWNNGATRIAFGNIDDDPQMEVAVARDSESNYRFHIYDDAATGYQEIFQGGKDWPKGRGVQTMAFGDVDGDGRDELALRRRVNKGNWRFTVLEDALGGFSEMMKGGEDWGDDNYPTGIAFGNVDDDPAQEMIVGRKASGNNRYWLLDDGTNSFRELFAGGKTMDDDNYVTAVAMGDIDGNGVDDVVIGRHTKGKAWRYRIMKWNGNSLANWYEDGQNWGGGRSVTAISLGDIDGDGRMEISITRKSDVNERYRIIQDPVDDPNFGVIFSGGEGWGGDFYATSIAFGDLDKDGLDEVMVGRNADRNERLFIFDDGTTFFQELDKKGSQWGSSSYVKQAAFGDTDGDGDMEIGYVKRAKGDQPFCIEQWSN